MTDEEAFLLMERHAALWNAHDLEGLLALFTEDCVFETAAGRGPHGEVHDGREAVGRAFAAIFATFPDARWDEAEHRLCGDRGLSTWVFRGTRGDGHRVDVRGLDLLTFRKGRILRKDTFRKTITG
jgi:uncharacterized protein (TIGR02246 family)